MIIIQKLQELTDTRPLCSLCDNPYDDDIMIFDKETNEWLCEYCYQLTHIERTT